jgi:hypothetical protein
VWPFRRDPVPTVTNDSYRRWLRAHRPPWGWFLRLSDLEQEQLALIGDEQFQDLAVAIGYAVADPRAADAGIAAAQGDTAAEETLAKQVAASLIQRLVARPAATAAPIATARESLGGFGDRRQNRLREAVAARTEGRRFFGRAPDEVKA